MEDTEALGRYRAKPSKIKARNADERMIGQSLHHDNSSCDLISRMSSLLFSMGQTAVKLCGAEAADRAQCTALISQKLNDKGEGLYPP